MGLLFRLLTWIQETAGDCRMTSQADFFVRSSTTGMIRCERRSIIRVSSKLTISFISIRAKVRDSVDGHDAFNDYWIRCLYEGEKGDTEDVEKGFLKSSLLVKARTPPTMRSGLQGTDCLPNRLFKCSLHRRHLHGVTLMKERSLSLGGNK